MLFGQLLGAGERLGQIVRALRCVVVIALRAPRLVEVHLARALFVVGGVPIVVIRLRPVGISVVIIVVAIGREAQLGAQGLLGFGKLFGDVLGAAGERRGPAPDCAPTFALTFALTFAPTLRPLGGIGLAAEQRFEKFVEAPGGGAAARGLGIMRIEPGEVREQQAAVEAHAAADRLAPVKDRLAGAVQRAVGEHLLGGIAREHQRRLPPLRQRRIAPLVDIGRLRRQPDRSAGEPDIAVRGEVVEELDLARGGEGGGAGGDEPLLPLILRLPEERGGWGLSKVIDLVLVNVFYLEGPTPGPSRRREGGRRTTRVARRDLPDNLQDNPDHFSAVGPLIITSRAGRCPTPTP